MGLSARLLASVVETSDAIAATSRRLAKIDLLSALLANLQGDEVEIVVRFLSGEPRQGKIGVGYALLRGIESTPADAPVLSILDVDRQLTAIAAARGPRAKAELLRPLLAAATAAEQSFLIRLLVGELRQGALEGIMVEGVARASRIDADRVRRAAMLAGNIARVAEAALTGGAAALEQFDIQLFRPLQPMLAQTAEDVDAALAEMGDTALEYKMDGARIQVHRDGDEVRVYTRSLNDVTDAVPEVVEAVRALPLRQAILDGELLAMTPEGRPQPFQVTMRRFGRKLDVHRMRESLPLSPFFFDALYVDGGGLLDESQERRAAELSRIVSVHQRMPALRTADPVAAAAFVRESLERGHEGVMAKSPTSAYLAGARGSGWLKIKQARTLDLVILAAEWGNGRRKGWLSNLHLGARDPERGGFAMLGRTFKGLTDAMLEWQTKELLALEVSRDQWTVYVEPRLVAEIAFNEIQVSPRYERGLALRFARVKRYRPDKSAVDADTLETVRKLAGYRNREGSV